MEYINRVFYRKINPSDFKKLYDIDIPKTGGGQTYLEAAGITYDELVDFLEYAEITDSPLENETRSIYTINARVLGNSSTNSFIEFAPRKDRANYRICRQNMRYKHPAWSLENGFPEPNKDENGNYTSEGNFEGIIDNLIIIILRTNYKKYYAGFVNADTLPANWPTGIGLERIFEGDRRGVINLSNIAVAFSDSLDCPFVFNGFSEREQGGENIILYGVPGAGKSWKIKQDYCDNDKFIERIVFHPDYTYSDFIGQILPKIYGETVEYSFEAGPFTRIMSKAFNNPGDMFYLIIEEINRGNAPAIFGDVFQLLDRDEKGSSRYSVSNENIAKFIFGIDTEKIFIPSNLTILATMNTADQNVFTLDTAFKRRWHMESIKNEIEKCSHANTNICNTNVTWLQFATEINNVIIENSKDNISSEDNRLGAWFIEEKDLSNPKWFAEKVLMYLWNDAFKFSRPEVFKSDCKTLDDVIDGFIEHRFCVFTDRFSFSDFDVVNEGEIDNP